tara:strand:+ start:81 stop:332 length:252 start_codon:yes stop_codon:yes gene_type:complete
MFKDAYEKWPHFMKYKIIFDRRLCAIFAQFWWKAVGGEGKYTQKQRFSSARAYLTSTLQWNYTTVARCKMGDGEVIIQSVTEG